MSDALEFRCGSASKNKHRECLPGYETTYQYFQNRKGFVYFLNNKLPENKVPSGWKFYISVHPDDLRRAWALIEPILLTMKQGILGFKVIDLTYYSTPDSVPCGNQIVIYTFNDPAGQLIQSAEDLFTVLIHVEKALHKAEIRAGKGTGVELKIKGSQYLFTRHDLDPTHRQYVSAQSALGLNARSPYNPFGQENPYAWFAISRIQQLFFSRLGFVLSNESNIVPTRHGLTSP